MPDLDAKRLTPNAKRGFTLIELLVVISIIAILITIIVATFGTTQKKARDSRRKTDLDALKKALELSKSDTKGAAWYPDCPSADSHGDCLLTDRTSFNPALDSVYIKDFPQDPGNLHAYVYDVHNAATCVADGCTSYELYACVENPKDNQAKVVPATGKAHNCSSGYAYSVTNP